MTTRRKVVYGLIVLAFFVFAFSFTYLGTGSGTVGP